MSDHPDARPALRVKAAELAVAAFFFLLGMVVVYDSLRLGVKWGDDGPQSGYFPFYVGLIICIASVMTFVGALRIDTRDNKPFVEVGQFRLVLSVLVPSALFVAAITWLGIYLPSILFIGFFMRWLGKYAWWTLSAVAFSVSATFFLIFEIWFKVPLPKGPVETLLGLN